VNKRKPRGRPKDVDKRSAVISAARQLFFARGLEAVKIEEIAADAGVSKMTIYANFVDKTALFEAVVFQESARIEHAFEHLQIETGRINDVLLRFGTTLMGFLLSAEVMRFDNMLSSEMARHPGLGQRFYRAGPDKMWKALTAIIEAAAAKGEISADNAKHAAEDLIALWFGMAPLLHRFNELQPMSDADIEVRVARGVRAFMKIYGADMR
jgi:TetR/AcrR family transcriptional regulator, mexJK operon transcriptional repressor